MYKGLLARGSSNTEAWRGEAARGVGELEGFVWAQGQSTWGQQELWLVVGTQLRKGPVVELSNLDFLGR